MASSAPARTDSSSAQGGRPSLVPVGGADDGAPLVAAQSLDVYGKRLDEYDYDFVRFLHVLGVRGTDEGGDGCFGNVYNGISIQPTPDLT